MASLQPTRNPELNTTVTKALHEHWRALLVEGIILIVLGAAMMITPPLAGLAATIWIGAIFLFGGIVGLVASLRAHGAPGFFWAVVSAALALLAGLLLLWNPMEGLVTLTYVMIAFFIFDGVALIFYAIAHRHALSGRWEWVLTNGLIDLFLAVIILSGMPGSSAWVLGLLLGIDLVFGGCALIAMALAAKKAAG